MDVEIICRQTNYTKEEAQQKLIELGDPILVIKDYMNIQKVTPEVKTAYSEIHKFMDFKHKY